MKPIIPFLVCFILLLSACKDEKPIDNAVTPEVSVKSIQKGNVQLSSAMDHFRIRTEPNLSAETVGMLSENEKVEYLEVKSDGEYLEVKLRGFTYKDPWVKVKNAEGVEGWVYGGGLKFEGDGEVAKILIETRLNALFGQELTEKVQYYQKKMNTASNSVELVSAFNLGIDLREKLVNIMHENIEVEDYDKLAELSWLEYAMPGYKTQLVAEGTMFHLFQDYNNLMKKANRTSGEEDNAFFELCRKIFPIDSIEHFFPTWFLQTWDYGGHSELGKGTHNSLLEQMNLVLVNSHLFEKRIEHYKSELIKDITDAHVTYWYPKEDILKELDEILEANYGILSEEDKIALKTRRSLFESPKENRIEVNHRAGYHDS